MTSQYLLQPPRSLFDVCAETPECRIEDDRCGNPQCSLASVCPLWQRDHAYAHTDFHWAE